MSTLWLITTYFNPLGWQSRRRNYQTFRRHLGANLLTVEWSPSGDFSLSDEDADRLLRVSGGDLMWQKERLINIGLAHLPDDCELVGWVDCDILFQDPLWQQKAIALLRDHEVIQLYGAAEYLEAGSPIDASFRSSVRRPSIIQNWQSAQDRNLFLELEAQEHEATIRSRVYIPKATHGSMGFAWAAQRSWLESLGGVPDRAIAGSGDRHFAMALLGRSDNYAAVLNRCGLGNYWSSHTEEWARQAQLSKARISCLNGLILHLHHGNLVNRAYAQRHFDLVKSGFLPDVHLEHDSSGAWRFNAETPTQTLQMMTSYFTSRREDGSKPDCRESDEPLGQT